MLNHFDTQIKLMSESLAEQQKKKFPRKYEVT